MKKKTGFIFFICLLFLFFTPLATALNDDISPSSGQPEGREELSSKIESSLPSISHEDAVELAEVIQLIGELEREIFLTGKIIELREKGEEYEEPLYEERPKILDIFEEVIRRPYLKEIIIAEQISEEPEKSLPREEKSLLAELESRERTERMRRVAAAPTLPLGIKVYSKEELEESNWNILVEKGEIALIPAVGLKRFMATDPTVLKLAREDDNKVSITGVNLGRTFVHIWDSGARRTIEVTVMPKGYSEFAKTRRRAIRAARLEPFKALYSFDRSRTNSKSDNALLSYHYTQWVHRLDVKGGTPWGRVDSRLLYEGREYGGGTELQRDLSAWNFNLNGPDLEMAFGNIGARFSDITIPGTGYQGIRFRNPDRKKINYDLVWGARGSRMWGYKISGWTNSNYFCGARGQIEPADFINFNVTAARALEDAEDIGEYIYAAGMGLNFWDDMIEIESEAARGKSEETDVHTHAYKIDTTVNLKDYNLTLEGTYRDISPDFLSVTGGDIAYIGELGYYFDADYNPLKYLRLTGEYDIFRNRLTFNYSDTKAYNYNWRGTIDFSIAPDTKFKYTTWKRMREGDSTPSHGIGESYQLSQTFLIPNPRRPLNFYVRYTPNQYRNLSSPSTDYREKRYGVGMNLNVLRNLYYDIAHNWHHRHMLESGELGTVRTLTTSLRYSTQILDTPFYGLLGLRYKKEYDIMENLQLTSGENIVGGRGEIRYRPSDDFQTYLSVDYSHIRGVLDHDKNRQEMRIYGGGAYLLDTTLRWGLGGSIRGFAFEDLNKNGMKDRGEKGLPGINVYAGEVYSTITDADGKFDFRRIKGNETAVILDTKALPEGYKATTPSHQIVKLERDVISEVDFGVMAIAEISGVVFNDVNMNGIFDEGDKGVIGTLLALDDGTVAQSMARGDYRMEDIKARTTVLTLDTMALPVNLIPLTEAKRTIEVKGGKYYTEDFALYALRTIVGTVFVDKNGNKQFDADEEGMADVILRCADSTAITDSQGRYFLKKLPGGAQEVILDVESIPSGYKLSVKPSRLVELLPEGEIREDVNFALIKR